MRMDFVCCAEPFDPFFGASDEEIRKSKRGNKAARGILIVVLSWRSWPIRGAAPVTTDLQISLLKQIGVQFVIFGSMPMNKSSLLFQRLRTSRVDFGAWLMAIMVKWSHSTGVRADMSCSSISA